MKTTTTIIYPAFALFALAYFALLPQARATCQDACLTNDNTVQGDDALISLTTGAENTAIGFEALLNNTAGFNNTATGFEALFSNTTGSNNTAAGEGALSNNTTGSNNTALGRAALLKNTIGSFNIALGDNAGLKLTRGNNNIEIGNQGIAGEADTIRIGTQGTQTATFIAGISGATIPTGVPVIVDSGGHLGTTTSSARFKEAIKPMDKASEAILSLKPVMFHYKHDLDPAGIPQFGLVAEEVEKVNPDLVARDGDGKAYTVRYEAVNAMLLNEFLKEHRRVEQEEAKLTEQASEIAELKTALARQAETLDKVTARLDARDSRDRLVDNR
jgi:hypothetical protein